MIQKDGDEEMEQKILFEIKGMYRDDFRVKGYEF